MKKTEELTLSVQGRNIEDAFSNAVPDLLSLMIDVNTIQHSVTKTLMIRSKDLKSLLHLYLKKSYDYAMSEALLLSKVNNLAIESINDEYMLTANISGEKLNKSHKLNANIKQVKGRNILIKESKDGCNLQINVVVEKDEV